MTRIDNLCAAYESFGLAIADVPDERANVLARTSSGVRDFIGAASLRTPKPKPSQAIAGLEQGWREIPTLIEGVDPQWRSFVSRAWFAANLEHYPEVLSKEKERLDKIIARGKIRTESELYRVRHEIDLLETEAAPSFTLQRLYLLVDEYESR